MGAMDQNGRGSRRGLLLVVALLVGVLALVWGGLLLRGDSGAGTAQDVVVADVSASTTPTTSTGTTAVATTAVAVPDGPAETTSSVPIKQAAGPLAPAPALPPADAEETATTSTEWVLRFATCAVPPVGSPVSSMYPEALGTDLPCKTAEGVSFGGIDALSPPRVDMNAIQSYAPDFIFGLAGPDVIVGWMTKADLWSHREIDGWRIPLYDSDLTTRNGWLVGGAGADVHFEPL